jgi:hypothetical protein
MSIQDVPIPALIAPTRNIAGFFATVTIEENATDDMEITQHPVQEGATITDHAYVKPAQVSIKMLFNDHDLPLRDTYAQLLALQASAVPFDVITGKRQYTNMLFKSLSQTTDHLTENVLSITAQLQQILIVSLSIVTVPARAKHKNPGKTGGTDNAGKKTPVPAEKKRVQSLLKQGVGVVTGP